MRIATVGEQEGVVVSMEESAGVVTQEITPVGSLPPHRWRRRGVVGAAAVLAVGVIASVASMSVAGDEVPRPLAVTVSDAGSSFSDQCSEEDYTGTFFDGAEVALLGADGAELATDRIDGAPEATQRGCVWTTTFTEVPASGSYTLRLTGADAPPRQHSFTYTPEELDEKGWELWVTVVA
ncbi:hypothetical protein [Georgenia sp. AZ-5]|uniref:hypothetical protein n=1 Tax=Georgenia sp. AZ-5 TaxID=3367526 RepID=UPI0037546326